MRIKEILKGISNVAIVVDDLVVTGSNAREHLDNLSKVLMKLNECGLKVKVDKSSFF